MPCTNAPSARYGHAAVALPGTNSIMVLFGAEQDRNVNDVHILDTGMQSAESIRERLMTEMASRYVDLDGSDHHRTYALTSHSAPRRYRYQ